MFTGSDLRKAADAVYWGNLLRIHKSLLNLTNKKIDEFATLEKAENVFFWKF